MINKYRVYYDTKNFTEFDLDIECDPDLQEEIDYLSENEVSHRDDDSNTYNLIRNAKKIEQRFKQMNKILTESLTKITKENLRAISNSVLNDEPIKRIESMFSDGSEIGMNLKNLCGAFIYLEDNPFVKLKKNTLVQRLLTKNDSKRKEARNKFGGEYLN